MLFQRWIGCGFGESVNLSAVRLRVGTVILCLIKKCVFVPFVYLWSLRPHDSDRRFIYFIYSSVHRQLKISMVKSMVK